MPSSSLFSVASMPRSLSGAKKPSTCAYSRPLRYRRSNRISPSVSTDSASTSLPAMIRPRWFSYRSKNRRKFRLSSRNSSAFTACR